MRWMVVLVLRVIVINFAMRVCSLPGLRIETWGTQLMGGLRMRLMRRVRRDHVYFGCGQTAAADLAHLQARAYVERRRSFFQAGKGKAGIDQRAQQHIAADSRKAFEVGNSHRIVILNCRCRTAASEHFDGQNGVHCAGAEALAIERDVLETSELEGGGDRVKHFEGEGTGQFVASQFDAGQRAVMADTQFSEAQLA
jgi:hypothetical protein